MNPPREQWLARLDVCWGRLISTKDNGPLRLALRAREGVVDAAVIVVPLLWSSSSSPLLCSSNKSTSRAVAHEAGCGRWVIGVVRMLLSLPISRGVG